MKDRMAPDPLSTGGKRGTARHRLLCLREWLSRTLGWGALALAPNLVWEVAQLPLYSIWSTARPAALAYAVAHCTLGDGIIAAASYLATATIVHSSDWPRVSPTRGLRFITALGLAYTAWSEYRNVYVAKNWAYAATMPTVSGIGLAPLAQWLFLPLVTLILLRRLHRGHPR